MTLLRRITHLETCSPSRWRVLFESEAKAVLEVAPKRPGETVIVLPDSVSEL